MALDIDTFASAAAGENETAALDGAQSPDRKLAKGPPCGGPTQSDMAVLPPGPFARSVKSERLEGVYEVLRPQKQTLPLLFASPHSGADYPAGFLAAAQVPLNSLRRSEDGFVDELFAAAPELGAPLLRALFPRSFVDANREPFELDPLLFDSPLPEYANSRSPRVKAGLGTVARIVANGDEIYGSGLTLEEGLARIRDYYGPYHEMLTRLVAQTRRNFGHCILIDCHSMPSLGTAARQASFPDIVLGDCFGSSCNPSLTRSVEAYLRDLGYRVARNRPYSGGYVTRHYGRPREGTHALQIEISRALYMDEIRVERRTGLASLAEDLRLLIGHLARLSSQAFQAA
jgi:N-formylglutamate amidohydrolase